MKYDKRITIIMPVYNEAAVIEDVIKDFNDKIMRRIPDVEFIVTEDGSSDGTKEILREVNKEVPFRLISGQNRKGYTKAFKDALNLVETDLVFFSDSDGQHEPADFFNLLNEIGENDIVSGYKFPRCDSRHRIVISKAYNLFTYLLFGLKLRDIDSGFKLIKKEVIDDVLSEVKNLPHCVMSEFILRAYLKGFKIKEVPVRHYSRMAGRTVIFHPKKLPLIILGIIKGLLRIKFNLVLNKRI